jgi:predicted small integral membrane protein
MACFFDGDDFTEYLWDSVSAVFGSISKELSARISSDLRRSEVLLAAAKTPNDPRYGIFTLTKASGDELFVSKRRSAPGMAQ